MTIELPIACSLDQHEMPARIEAWSSLLEEALITRAATDDGVRLDLRSSPDARQRLEELVALESRCCDWMKFEIRDEQEPRVDITARDNLGRRAVRDLFLTDLPA